LKKSRRAKKETFLAHTNNALSSVSANTPANLAEAIRKAQDCFQAATEQRDPAHFRKLQCDDWEGLKALQVSLLIVRGRELMSGQDAYLSVTNQFVGYLPPNVLNDVIDGITLSVASSRSDDHLIASDNAFTKPDKEDARHHLNNALRSVGASTSGESATLFVTLTLCLNNLVMDNRAGLAVDCLAQVRSSVKAPDRS